VGPRAHDDAAATRAVGLADPLPPEDDRAGREVRPLDVPREPVDVDVGLVDHRDKGVDDLAEVMRSDVRRHPDCDAGGAVDEQVREARWKHRRLPPRLVVVRSEVDSVGVDVAEHFRGDPRQSRLGVVADEAIREKRVIVAVDSERVDRLNACILDRLDGRVEVVAGYQRLYNPLDLLRLDSLEDCGSAALQPLDTVDVVPPQPA
jgi:hypothetical protein